MHLPNRMHNNHHFMIPSPPQNDNALSVNSLYTEISSGSSFVTPLYSPSPQFDPSALFPVLPVSSLEGISDQIQFTESEDAGENALSVLWDFNEFNTNILPLTSSVSFNTSSNLRQSFSSSQDYLFPPVEQIREQQEWQPSQQREEQNNENDMNFQFNPSSSEAFEGVYFPSPLSLNIPYPANIPDSDQIVFPESSKSAPLFRENLPVSDFCNRSRRPQQRKVGGLFCPICKKPFGRPQEVKRHSAIHTGVKNYKCSECGYPFQRKDALDRHQKTLAGRCRERRPSFRQPSME